jgi:hypothetical protein
VLLKLTTESMLLMLNRITIRVDLLLGKRAEDERYFSESDATRKSFLWICEWVYLQGNLEVMFERKGVGS